MVGAQVMWALCVYLEAVSVLPQLRMMQNAKVPHAARSSSCTEHIAQRGQLPMAALPTQKLFRPAQFWTHCPHIGQCVLRARKRCQLLGKLLVGRGVCIGPARLPPVPAYLQLFLPRRSALRAHLQAQLSLTYTMPVCFLDVRDLQV